MPSRYRRLLSYMETGNTEEAKDLLKFFIEKYEELEKRSFCAECNTTELHQFMVTDEVWKRAGMEKKGFLCLPCLYQRLDGELCIEDFIEAPVNREILFGYRLGHRDGIEANKEKTK